MELQKSAKSIGKLERLISSMALESQCEIESMKLDMMALEQSILESRKIQKDSVEEKSKMTRLIEELQVAYQDAQNVIISLNEESRELKKKLNAADMLAKELSQKVEEWLENKGISKIYGQTSLTEQDCNPSISKDRSVYGELLVPLLARLTRVFEHDANSKEMERMSCQIQEYEFLVEKLKEEVREERLKAKEEAEGLAQEMAELRYKITALLEEERKRRAWIEQASLQRISELEAQLQKEKKIPTIAFRHLPET